MGIKTSFGPAGKQIKKKQTNTHTSCIDKKWK